mgnify:CR=1 FL=1
MSFNELIRTEHWTVVILDVAIILQLLGMIFAVIEDRYIQKHDRNMLIVAAGLILSLLVRGHLDWLISGGFMDAGNNTRILLTLLTIYGYAVRPVVIVLFIRLTRPEGKAWPMYGMVILNALIYLTALFWPGTFYFTDDGHFVRGTLGYFCFLISFILLDHLFFVAIKAYAHIRRRDTIIPLFITVVVILAVVGDLYTSVSLPVSFLSAAMTSCAVFYYIWLHLKFVREHEQSMLAESRIKIMISQIQPHFLYNTLSAIQALCTKDPQTAARTVEKFGEYLRQNLASLGQSDLIPLRKELEHTKTYAEIEQLMFPNLRVEYYVDHPNFLLPALTIQPLVENAIRHGVRGKKDGLVTIVTKKENDGHVIVIRDNGKGFDDSMELEAGDKHIGIRNVRERVEKMCNGTLEVSSTVGEGTEVVIRIPFRKETA